MVDARRAQFLAEIADLSYEELMERLAQENASLVDLKNQLGTARARQHSTGEYADSDWYSRCDAARRHHGWQAQMIQIRLAKRRRDRASEELRRHTENGDLSRARRKQRTETFERVFLQNAEAILPHDVFEAILKATRVMNRQLKQAD